MRLFVALILTAFLAVPAFAAFEGPGADGKGGFKGSGANAPASTVEQVKNLADDVIVAVTGNVISKVAGSKDKYNFRDASGEMIVEIDQKRFRGQTVTPETTVRLIGKVDKDFGKPVKLDVKQLEVIQ